MNQLFLNATGLKNGLNNNRFSCTDLPKSTPTSYNAVDYQEERIPIPHTFQVHTYGIPTVCQYCKKLLKGLFKQGVQCRDCQYNAHKKCLDKVPQDCTGEHQLCIPPLAYANNTANSVATTLASINQQNNDNDHFFREEFDDSDLDDNCSTLPDQTLFRAQRNTHNHYQTETYNHSNTFAAQTKGEQHNIKTVNAISNDQISKEGEENTEDYTTESAEISFVNTERSASVYPQTSNIPLMRIVQSVKHTKRRQGQSLKEGWLVHYTNLDRTVKRYYWRLDAKSITLFVSEKGSKYYKDIQLADIQSIEVNGNLSSHRNYCFELRTNDIVYYIGQDPLAGVKEEHAVRLPPPDSGIGSDIAKSWETSIKQAFMHVTNTRKSILIFTF